MAANVQFPVVRIVSKTATKPMSIAVVHAQSVPTARIVSKEAIAHRAFVDPMASVRLQFAQMVSKMATKPTSIVAVPVILAR
jgi:hypothetical protein